jgi:hypothetical protein
MSLVANLLHYIAYKIEGGQKSINIELRVLPQNVGAVAEINEEDAVDESHLQLHIQEYIALRSEQRTRLDSANKIIHYSAIVIAALIAGLITLYKDTEAGKFDEAFKNVLLLFPLVSMPFALTQQNEEIMVRRIGDYFSEMKGKIKGYAPSEYWGWENWHNKKGLHILHITGFFRAGLLIIFSLCSMIIYLYLIKCNLPYDYRLVLFILDLLLFGLASYVAIRMGIKRLKGQPLD